jgi:hypothetical protein
MQLVMSELHNKFERLTSKSCDDGNANHFHFFFERVNKGLNEGVITIIA